MAVIEFYDYEGKIPIIYTTWLEENCCRNTWFFIDYSVLLDGVMYYKNTTEFKIEFEKYKMWEKLRD